MRQYYEARETLPEGSEIVPDFIRMDITDVPLDDRPEILQLIKDQFVDLVYTLILHNCNHDTGVPCTEEAI